ncbi:hypothetical protein OIV83_004495 [Microbotryomycetes sp. JL201]|nr:hypothetical protein OIV83_004495 [Microbotryomycetes sp. JL201]
MSTTATQPHVGQRINLTVKDSATGLDRVYLGTVRYIGPVEPTAGYWLGIEWDIVDGTHGRGRHSGTYDKTGVEYFKCTVPGTGSFLRPQALGSDYAGKSFWRAVEQRYVLAEDERPASFGEPSTYKLHVTDLSAIEQRFRKLNVKEIGLEWQGVNGPGSDSDRTSVRDRLAAVRTVNLSFSQIATIKDLSAIVEDMLGVDTLYFNCNRVAYVDRYLDLAAFGKLKKLTLNRTLMQWSELVRLSPNLVNLTHLEFGDNPIPIESMTKIDKLQLPRLESLNLEGCGLAEWQVVAETVESLPLLETLLIARNRIQNVTTSSRKLRLRHLSLAANLLAEWSDFNNLASVSPDLESLAVLGNPIFKDLPERDVRLGIVARVSSIGTLDNSPISVSERSDAELWYLGQIAREPGTDADKVAQHPRWRQLSTKHGADQRADPAPPPKLRAQLMGKRFRKSQQFWSKLTLRVHCAELNVLSGDNVSGPVSVKLLPTAKTLQLRALAARATGKPIPKSRFKLIAEFTSANGESQRVEIPPDQEAREVSWWGLGDGDSIRVEALHMSGGFSLARTASLDSTIHIVATPSSPTASTSTAPPRRAARPSTANSSYSQSASSLSRYGQQDSSSSASSRLSAQNRLKMPGAEDLSPMAVVLLENEVKRERSAPASQRSTPKPKSGNKLLARLGFSSRSKKHAHDPRIVNPEMLTPTEAQRAAVVQKPGPQQHIKDAANHLRDQSKKLVKLVKRKLSSKTPKEDLPKTWEEYQQRYINNEMDLEDPPMPPTQTADGSPTPLVTKCFMPPLPANEAARQNVVNRLDLFGTKAAAASTTTLPGSSRRDADNSSLTPSTARSHVSNVEEAVCSMKDHPAFRDIVTQCKDMFDSKVSMLTVLDDDQQLFLVTGGMDLGPGLPRSVTFCAHAIMDDENNGMVVLDAQNDWRFANGVPAQQLGAKFYAGVPLLAPSFGDPDAPPIPIGTLCVADDRPREEFTEEQRQYLHDMAAKASAEVEKWVNDRMMGKLSRLEESFQASTITLPGTSSTEAGPRSLQPSALPDERQASELHDDTDDRDDDTDEMPSRATTPVSPSAMPIPPPRSERRPKTPVSRSLAPIGSLPPPPLAPPAILRSARPEHVRAGSDAVSDATTLSRRNSADAASISSATTALTAPSISSSRNKTTGGGLSLAVTSEAPVSAIPRDLQRVFDQAVRMLAKALDLSLVYLVSLDLSLQNVTGPTLKVLASHGMPSPAPSFDPALHMKALRAPEGGLLYKNPRFSSTPNATAPDSPAFAIGMLIPILEVRRTGFVLAGYTKDAERQFEQRDLSVLVKFAEQLESFCTKVGKGSSVVA